jgi:hypothetical protein
MFLIEGFVEGEKPAPITRIVKGAAHEKPTPAKPWATHCLQISHKIKYL